MNIAGNLNRKEKPRIKNFHVVSLTYNKQTLTSTMPEVYVSTYFQGGDVAQEKYSVNNNIYR